MPRDAVARARTQRRRLASGWLLAGLLLASCAARHADDAPVAAPAMPVGYVVLGAGGEVLARAVTADAQCPPLLVDELAQPMRTRAPAQTVPRRPQQAKESVFAAQVCEAVVPAGARALRLGATPLPLPRARVGRIVVLGDTGCRIKVAEHAFQDCSDPARWPFARIAAAAAREAPDLVIHVGDYHYRENACPPGEACANSVWGYGGDAWRADFFDPAAPLLRAAPWIVARGNHEECARAGQGWFRLLDPAPFDARRSCDAPRDDAAADFSEPYAVPLGGDWQVIVFDSALASRPVDPARPADAHLLERYRANLRVVDALAAAPGMHSLFVSHHPALGFTVAGASVHFGNDALVAAMRSDQGTRYFAPGIDAGVHGHVHSFQAIDFASGHPAALVAGHGGDQLDPSLEGREPASAYASVEGVRIGTVATSHSFGYLVLERAADGWGVHARRPDGSALTDCTLRGRHLACDERVPTAHPRDAAALPGG
jgi:hypothetical protein